MSSWRDSIALFFASVGGLGFVPFAPGTAGSVFPVLLAYWLRGHSKMWMVIAFGAACAVAFPSIQRVLDRLCEQQTRIGAVDHELERPMCCRKLIGRSLVDPSFIVIDEVIGQLLCLFIVSCYSNLFFKEIFVSFALFRVFDILKPWPIKFIERTLEQKPAFQALSIILDDILAGLLGGGAAVALLKIIN
ncbi:MAG: phosphatidylglycerophosphatase A [Holosporales bacterium]|jgi:phosphatidylglycerophosphatase A|nr:phosphatidylglycerophosphatase A [Holosporales bacterium]